MKRKRYSVEQIVAAVKQHEMGLPAGDIARKLGIAEQTFYRWKKQYGGLEATEVRELTQLREECLNVHWFEDVTDVRANMQVWQKEYNEDRPHRSLKNLTPLPYKTQWQRWLGKSEQGR